MAKPEQKTQKFGYRLSINRSSLPGARNWEQVGFVFASTHEANEYRKSKYPDITKWTIQGVRVKVGPNKGEE